MQTWSASHVGATREACPPPPALPDRLRCRACCVGLLPACLKQPPLHAHPPLGPLLGSFEALCTGQAVADSTAEFGMLIRTRIGPHRIFMGAEMDCHDADAWQPPAAGGGAPQQGTAQQGTQQGAAHLPPLSCLLELKTYKQPAHAGQQRNVYRFKHPKWWLQSFLAGVPRLVLGARDEQVRPGQAPALMLGVPASASTPTYLTPSEPLRPAAGHPAAAGHSAHGRPAAHLCPQRRSV